MVSLYTVFQITFAVMHRLEFEEAKVKSAIVHGELDERCTCMIRKSRRAAVSKTKRPTSVIFLGHILSNLLDSVGGDGLPQDQVDLLLSRHSILRRDLTIIMKSIVLHWLDTRFDIVAHLQKVSSTAISSSLCLV